MQVINLIKLHFFFFAREETEISQTPFHPTQPEIARNVFQKF